MTPERWRLINEIFHAVAERTPQQADEFLRSACGGDGELESMVRRMVERCICSRRKPGLLRPPEIRTYRPRRMRDAYPSRGATRSSVFWAAAAWGKCTKPRIWN